MLTCFDIAKYFIRFANETGDYISNLKLQKLVYYAQAWHIALKDAPLFEEDFQAWIHGPVVPELYHQYKSFGWRPIDESVELDLPAEVVGFLEEVSEEYFSCTAYELEQMTHLEDPWKRARAGLPSDAPSTEVIKKEWMKEYYQPRGEDQKN